MITEIKRGMLIRELREADDIDVVLDAGEAARTGDELLVATKNHPGGLVQTLTTCAEVRWPWEPETAWRRVTG